MKFSFLALTLLALALAGGACVRAADSMPPENARDFFNAGTRLLDGKKYTEAEAMFESALAVQEEALQPAALYNIGHARFDEGLDMLKKGPDAQKALDRGNSALASGDHALQQADSALSQSDPGQILSAYLAGRGARHNVHEAEKAIQSAMEIYGNTLRKWQRSDDDFKSTAELNPHDHNATHNAQVVEQGIAKLVDLIRKMQQMAGALASKHDQLNRAMNRLKGQMPGMQAPPGGPGEGDDDDDNNGMTPDALSGKTENAIQQGGEMQMQISPDQAAQILQGLQIDGTRRLPMGGTEQGSPVQRNNGRTW